MITEEQIIEYLEHCSTTESCHKDKCPCLKDGHTCIAFESKPVLELIRRQQAEIKKWQDRAFALAMLNKANEKRGEEE